MKYFLPVLTSIFLGLVIWLAYPILRSEKIKVISSLPDFLTMAKNRQVTTLDLWLPQIEDDNKKMGIAPNISAKTALIYDLTSNQVLFSKNPKDKLPIASLTKVMTAIIALENKRKDDRYLVTKDSLVGENSMGLTAGEVLTIDELLYGLLLPSGNDASETLADSFPSGRDGFIKAMNSKAKAMGLRDSNFTNPSGLEGDGNQYSTAYDLLVITRYALSNFPLFNEIVSTPEYNIAGTQTHKEYFLQNETNLLTSYPGVKGVKTGYTPEAGLCLITYLDYDGHQIIGILLGSNNRREEMRELLDYSKLEAQFDLRYNGT